MIRRMFTALALLVLLAPGVRAETLTLDQVLSKHYEAEGGLEKMGKMKTVRMTGRMEVGPGMEAPFTMEKKRPASTRMDFTFSGMTGTRAYDGKQGWAVMPFMGKKDPEPMAEDEAKEMAENADFDGPLVDWKGKGSTLELMPNESVDGADAYKLKLTRKGGGVEYYYLDAETFLLVKEEAKRTVRGTEIEAESTIGDYKDVNGFMMPFSITNSAKGSEHKQAMTFDKIEIDVPIEDTRFVMPVSAAADSAAKAAASAKPAAPAKPAKKNK